MSTLHKIAKLESLNIIPEEQKEKINKLLSVKRPSQWYLLRLREEDCDEIESILESIEKKSEENFKIARKIESVKHECIPITINEDDFI